MRIEKLQIINGPRGLAMLMSVGAWLYREPTKPLVFKVRYKDGDMNVILGELKARLRLLAPDDSYRAFSNRFMIVLEDLENSGTLWAGWYTPRSAGGALRRIDDIKSIDWAELSELDERDLL